MLEVKELHAFYGKSHVLQGVSFAVRPGEIVALLGRNGVGRSTSIKAIMGLVAAHGSVRFKGEELIGMPVATSQSRTTWSAPAEAVQRLRAAGLPVTVLNPDLRRVYDLTK